MSKSTLFVCKSCRTSHTDSTETPADGEILLDHLLEVYQGWSRQSELDIKPVGCLWTCDHPCAIALSSLHKSTYVLAKVPVSGEIVEQTARAILDWSQLYLDSQDGNIPWKKFPDVLQTDIVAQVPSLTPSLEN